MKGHFLSVTGITAPYDADAAAYIRAVEAADKQSLEYGVKAAINNFVIGCKADGIWNAIRASCILAGARTLAGALVPLVGTAPTNFNFVSGDYNRKTGLIGNGSTKYLNTNRAGDADALNDVHSSVYQSSLSTGIVSGFNVTTTNNTSTLLFAMSSGSTTVSARSRNPSTLTISATNVAGLIGQSRSSSTGFTLRGSGVQSFITNGSTFTSSLSFFKFAQNLNGTAGSHTAARIAFYSIGTSLNLALLDARVTTLINAIAAAIPTYDPDAEAYISAVEAADGLPLEYGIKTAINNFVVGCKADGIWTAIKASCILAGARTLAGALVPLVGTAPTNFNFTSSDYNRKTGLVGNASTKYLNTNRANNADPQNNKHLAAYATTAPTSATAYPAYIGIDASLAGASVIGIGTSAMQAYYVINSNTGSPTATGISGTGLVGGARSASSATNARFSGANYTGTDVSQAPNSSSLLVFAEAATGRPLNYSNARIAFYSIGEFLNLALLDARVTALMSAIAAALPPGYDPNAEAYISAVEVADGQSLEPGVKDAINAFVVGCKADGIWGAINASCILAGARTLAGALVPLVGTAPTNFNFTSADYDRQTGLVGDGSTKYLNSNLNNNAVSQDSRHFGLYVSTADSQGVIGRQYIGTQDITGGSVIGRSGIPANLFGALSNESVAPFTGRGSHTGFIGLVRSSSASITMRSITTESTITIASQTTRNESIFVFARPGSPAQIWTNARIAFYSIGSSINLALLDARVNTLINSISNAISSTGIIVSGSLLNLDAGNSLSYPGTGTTWFDLSGNANNGTLINGPTYSSANGGSIVFDGTNDNVSSFPAQILGSGSKTISVWFKTNSIGRSGLVGIRPAGVGAGGWVFTINRTASGNLSYFHTSGPIIEINANITTNKWYNASVTYSLSSLTAVLYINGSQLGSPVTSFIDIISTSFKGVIGNEQESSSSEFLNGNIGQVLLYNRALSAAEILQNFNATRNRFGI